MSKAYISTRGEAPAISFREAVLTGLASDGGLYVPREWPRLSSADLDALKGRSFAETAAAVLARFAHGEIEEAALGEMAMRAYKGFQDPATAAPLAAIESGGVHLLELFHGPTLAFKDVAMQMLAQLYDWALQDGDRKTIIGATSGDTGGAAVDAFAGAENVDVYMLHPKGRISDVQRRIMTTNKASNIVNIAVDGSFDDCQAIVKSLFSHDRLSAARNLGGVNSINWVRLAVQTVYYFTTCARLEEAQGKSVNFVVPTGNFGDVFAGFVAKRMGAPIGKLAVAVNENDIMHRVLTNGAYKPDSVTPTTSPSMDIQVASNFERLLFEASRRDAARIREFMQDFNTMGGMDVPTAWLEYMQEDFVSARASEKAVKAKIASIKEQEDILIDPHTAVGLVAADTLVHDGALGGPNVVLATAHPAKFPDAVEAAAGERPGLPVHFADLFDRPERMLEASANVDQIADLILANARPDMIDADTGIHNA